jgi:hypothetical protein
MIGKQIENINLRRAIVLTLNYCAMVVCMAPDFNHSPLAENGTNWKRGARLKGNPSLLAIDRLTEADAPDARPPLDIGVNLFINDPGPLPGSACATS